MLLELLTAASLALSPAKQDSTLQQRLVAQGHDEAVVQELFDEPINQTVVDRFTANPEKDGREGELTQEEYNEVLGVSELKDRLPEVIQNNRESLQEAYEEYGVDPRYIAAILGVETRYGDITGSIDVTQAYRTIHNEVPRRQEFALNQAECLVELAEEYGVETVDEWEGSYAGAMGYGQFIPCSVEGYYEGELHDMDDAIESIANYLRNVDQVYPPTGEPARWDPAHNGEPLTEDGNYLAIWAYNRSSFYINAVDEVASSVPYTQLVEADTQDRKTGSW